MLVVRNLQVFYGQIHAVRRATFHVAKGEIVALLGGNGAGKTTILATLSGLLRAKEGRIAFAGAAIERQRPERIVRLGLSHVPEGRLVFKPLSVEDNLRLGAFHRGRAGASDLGHVFELFPKLLERRGQLAGTLSGGEQQMLAIGRALMAKPSMLLLDEPGMGLAPTIIKEIFQHISKLREAFGLTVLLVEQNAKMALKIADRGYVLETGRIILEGRAEELLQNRDVQRAYLGRDVDGES